jgi:hypothetical protein
MSPHSTSLRSISALILPSTPGSFKWSPSLRFPYYNPVCTSSLHHTCYISCPSQSSWLDHPNDIWWGIQSFLYVVFYILVTSSLLGPNILLSTLFSKTLSLYSSFSVSDQLSQS